MLVVERSHGLLKAVKRLFAGARVLSDVAGEEDGGLVGVLTFLMSETSRGMLAE